MTTFFPLPVGRDGPAFFDEATVFLATGGLPWPDVLSTFTEDGVRSGPGVLMLIVPRQFMGLAGMGLVGPGPRAGP
ncbi:hypothetical protein GCM10010435_14400 [Winogradskya consettensis]|uniref:Uncharacterized protein n=1 Tax=Winogradskya consettensis TaxID=113560 RepID=A0A919SEB1_9ACTN|nr:hypothetical protein Aco04nite_13670 [Actinoplanes consettensis]